MIVERTIIQGQYSLYQFIFPGKVHGGIVVEIEGNFFDLITSILPIAPMTAITDNRGSAHAKLFYKPALNLLDDFFVEGTHTKDNAFLCTD
jgi:hypothetical protein